VWRLLGGKGRTRVGAYASLLRIGRPDDVARVAAAAVERGYRAIKLHEYTVEALAATRAAVGPQVPIMLDTNCHWLTVEDAAAVARGLKPHGLAWLEEPLFPPDDFEGLARLRRDSGVPIAAGENLGNILDVRRICEAGAVDVVQPSLAKMGGITEIVKAIADARARGVRVVPHSPYSGPALAANLHVLAAADDEMLCEYRYGDLAVRPLGEAIVSRDGHIQVPDGPGLGIEVDLDAIAPYRAG
jgi:L-alanine-DL-glutamate epimerase-like enolase superfamily enzyme